MGALSDAESSARGLRHHRGPGAATAGRAGPRAARSSDFQDLRTLTSDNPVEQGRLDQLEPLITQRLDALRQLLDTPGDESQARRRSCMKARPT